MRKRGTFLTRLIELSSSLFFSISGGGEAARWKFPFLGEMRCVGRRHKNKEQGGGTEEGRFLSD